MDYLWNQITGEIRDYPRADSEPVVGLEEPPWSVISSINLPAPSYNQDTEILIPTRIVDPNIKKLVFGWKVEPKPPDYQRFYDGILVSTVYQSVMTLEGKSGDFSAALSVFSNILAENKNVKENRDALQLAIWQLMAKLNLDPSGMGELQQLLNESNMASIYTLVPPQ